MNLPNGTRYSTTPADTTGIPRFSPQIENTHGSGTSRRALYRPEPTAPAEATRGATVQPLSGHLAGRGLGAEVGVLSVDLEESGVRVEQPADEAELPALRPRRGDEDRLPGRQRQALDPRRECTVCPPQISHCVHFDGQVLCLAETHSACHTPYSMAFVHGPPLLTCRFCDLPGWDREKFDLVGIYDSRDAALAAFRDAEAALLRGEP